MSSSLPSALHRQQLIEIYEKHAPDKLKTVDDLLQRFAGREEALVRAVQRKYAPDAQCAALPIPPPHREPSPAVNVSQEESAVEKTPLRSTGVECASRSPSELIVATKAVPLPKGATTECNSEVSSISSYHARLTRIYEAHAPLRVSRVTHELEKYKGREQEVIEAAVARFGPEPPVPPVTPTAPECSDKMNVSTMPTSASLNSSSALALQSSDFRVRALELYLRYDPSKAHKVDAQLLRFQGQEEAYLRSLERKLREGSRVREDESLTAEGGPSALSSNTPAALQAAKRSNEDSYEQRLMRIYEVYAPDKVHRAARQLERYPGREEEVIQAAVAKYGPEPTTVCGGRGAELQECQTEGQEPPKEAAKAAEDALGRSVTLGRSPAREGEAAEEGKPQEQAAVAARA
ncbi:hypothetical protein ABL78_5422, partial [Leptomonas seymouri]